jgi:hypothetical protein
MDDTSDELSSYGTCIVCQEDLNEPKAFGSLGLVQPSRLLRNHPDSHSQYLNELMTMPQSLNRASPHNTTFPPANAEELDATSSPNFDGLPTQHTHFGLHASACGHMKSIIPPFCDGTAHMRQEIILKTSSARSTSARFVRAWAMSFSPFFTPTMLLQARPPPQTRFEPQG